MYINSSCIEHLKEFKYVPTCIVPDESIGRRSGNFAVPPQGYLFTTYGNNQHVQLIQNLDLANFKKFLTLI